MAEEEAPKSKAKGGPGRGHSWEPTDKQRAAARSMFAAGASWRQVSDRLGIAKSTAEKHLRKEFEEGWDDANLQLHATMLELAIRKKNPTMLIWLSKNRMGWSDRQEHTGAAAPPLRHELSLRVEYLIPSDPRALPPPPPGTQMIDAKAKIIAEEPAPDKAQAA